MDTSFPDDIAQLKVLLREQMAANKILAGNNLLLSQRVASYASEISRLKALVVKLQRMQFGQSSEKIRQKAERQIREVQEHISHLQEEMADI
ncbi:transposase, partial [Xenorhabdus bovienii]|nr:transposase [Xenorhabdus bovienii]